MDTIRISNPHTWPVPRVKVKGDWIAHVLCEGARFHVLSYDSVGVQCSEPNCIVNKRYQETVKEKRW